MSRNKSSRRMFLRGAAGASLAIPFLPSLADKTAQAAPGDNPKRFVAIATDHGGVWAPNMYPSDQLLTDQQSYVHQVRRGLLPSDVQGDMTVISPVLSAPSARLTPELVQKMNVMRGWDVTFYLAHHRGGHLGNYAECDGNGMDGTNLQQSPRPTIDQIMAWSDSFYPDLGTILERSLHMGGNGMSAVWTSPATKSGGIQNITPENNSLNLFNKIFVPPADPVDIREPIVDLVFEDYQRLRDSNKRLSAADRQRLEEHLERVEELQRKINVLVSCGDIDVPTMASTDFQGSGYSVDPDRQRQFWELMNDVIVAAFSCDTCRIVTMRVSDKFSTYGGDWHQDVAHQSGNSQAQQQILADAHQRTFQDVFVDLIAKLDAAQDLDGSVLDNSLVQWTQEAGVKTHDPIEMPIVTAGSAGGYIQTGQYLDYRNLNKQAFTADPANNEFVDGHIGLVYNQWLGFALRAMGVPATEYEDGQNAGYGHLVTSTEGWYAGYQAYDAELTALADDPPFLVA
jgi:Protein of unknown function (DUF1552)